MRRNRDQPFFENFQTRRYSNFDDSKVANPRVKRIANTRRFSPNSHVLFISAGQIFVGVVSIVETTMKSSREKYYYYYYYYFSRDEFSLLDHDQTRLNWSTSPLTFLC